MTNVKTLPENEAVANQTSGYMHRVHVGYYTIWIIGDYVAHWSTNTLEQSVTVS